MNRNKKDANTAIFKLLDDYCRTRDEPIANEGAPRWISTRSHEREFLVKAALASHLAFSPSVKIARFDLSNRAYFVTVGLDTVETPNGLITEDLSAGVLTALLAELKPKPIVTPPRIRDIVEFADNDSTQGYDGHDHRLIETLFPKVQVFSAEDTLPEQSLRNFFLICLADRRRADQWIDGQLADTLAAIADLSPKAAPLATICRALLDMDPSSLYLALYRCLEALYAHAQTHKLMTAVGLGNKDWMEMAGMLEATLGWYPREEPSLEQLLSGVAPDYLHDIASALNEPIPSDAKEAPFIAKKIYRLRNGLVHYRPFHRRESVELLNWNRLCEAMANLVLRVQAERLHS